MPFSHRVSGYFFTILINDLNSVINNKGAFDFWNYMRRYCCTTATVHSLWKRMFKLRSTNFNMNLAIVRYKQLMQIIT